MKFRRLLLFTIVLFMICFTLRAELFDEGHLPSITSGMLLPDGDFVLWTAGSESPFLLKAQRKSKSTKSIKKLTTPTFSATALSAGDHNQKLALGSSDGSILVRNVSEIFDRKGLIGAHFLKLPQEKQVTALAFSPDEQTLASGTEDGNIAVWDTESGKRLFLLTHTQKNAVTTVSFSPNGMYLASGATDGSVILWNVQNEQGQRKIDTLNGHDKAVNTVAFSPNSQTLATGADDKLINLWKMPELTEPIELKGHAGAVEAISFSPDEIHLASGGSLGEVLLWDITNKNNRKIEPRKRYLKIKNLEKLDRAHQKDIVAITFTENGDKLISVCQNKIIEWFLSKIEINPERSELFFAEKPNPLIEKLREQDKTAPVVEIENVDTEVDSEDTETIVKGRVTDLNEIPSFTVNGADVEISETGEFETRVYLEVGENEIPIVAIDHNDNKNDEIILSIYRKPPPDNTKPRVRIINKEFNEANVAYVEYNQDVFDVQVEATDKSGVKEVKVNGQRANIVNQLFTARVNLQDGEQYIEVVAEDNRENFSDVITLTIHRKPKTDTELPVITIEGIADGEQRNVEAGMDTYLVKGIVSDKSGISTVKVKVNNTIVHDFEETEIKDGEFTATVSLHDGNNEITIIAIDNHDNENEKQFTINRLPQRPIVQPIDTDAGTTEPIKKQTSEDYKIQSEDYKIQIVTPIKDEDNIIKSADNPIFVLFKVSPSNNIDVNVQIRYADRNLDFPCVVEHQGGEFFRSTIALTTDQSTMKINVESEGQTVATEQYTIIRQSTTPNTQTDESKPLPVEPSPTDRLESIKIVSLHIQNVKLDKSKSYSKGIIETEPDGIEVDFSDSGEIPRIAVTTSTMSGLIDIIGETEGPSGGTIKYTINSDNRINVKEYGKYGTEGHEFQLTKEQNQQVVLGYGDNTLTFYAVPPGGTQADHIQELIINRVHEREGKDYALLIAVDDYSNSEWKSLDAPIADAEALKDILETEYGFEMYPEKGKIVENPTRREIEDLLTNLMETEELQKTDAQLLIYMAGHGYARRYNREKVEGYFLPKPSEEGLPKPKREDEDFDDKYDELKAASISHLYLSDTIDHIQCDNILVIMDTCYSGAFNGEVVNNRGGKRRLNDDKIREKLTKITRQYLTSGAIETVLDRQSGEKHSPFALQLLKALKVGDTDKDSIVTFNELQGYFLPKEFKKATGAEQSPRAGKFGKKHESGSEFLLWRRPRKH